MKKQPDNYLYLLKKVHGWCKRQGMTDPEMYFQCTFREFLRRYGMLLTKIETRNNQYGGHHTSPSHRLRVRKYLVVQIQN